MARNSRQQAPIHIMKSFKVKPEFFAVLKKLTSTHFTVDDLTEAYLSADACAHSSKKAARQFVYRNMQRLMKSGGLLRLAVDQGWPQYKLTELFASQNHTQQVKPQYENSEAIPVKQDPTQSLRERLSRYKVDMLSAMGEVEEYDAICAEMPELREGVQSRYNESRDRCSKLLGRVKALESLLSDAPR